MMFNKYVSPNSPASTPFVEALMDFIAVAGELDIDMMRFLYGNGQ